MNNSRPNSLGDIVDQHALEGKFIGNPLDAYENYTYNLELFVVDRAADRNFQLQEGFMMKDIVNDKWPGPNDNSITIAKTGVTTEFNLTDVDIVSKGVGNSTNSKIAGTGIEIGLSITQIGETSLVDNMQNAFVLCGYPGINGNNFYIKINFVGYDIKGNAMSIPNSTKVIPFTNTSWADMQSETDAKGTTTRLNGIIPGDEVVSGKALSVTDTGFTYLIGKTLGQTLTNFMDALNKSNRVNHPTLSDNLQNTYKFTRSTEFENKYLNTTMVNNTMNWTGVQNMVQSGPPGGAQFVGTVTPQMSIYDIIIEICLNSEEMKKELVKDKDFFTDSLKVSPYLVNKVNGYNPVTATNTFDVEFYIDYEPAIIVQNPSNQAEQSLASKKIIDEYFKSERVNKIYNYLFTGKNDQILDFTISLDKMLAKVYTSPSDSYRLEHFLRTDIMEGKYLSDEQKAFITEIEADLKVMTDKNTVTAAITESALESQTEGQSRVRNAIAIQLAALEGKKASAMPPQLQKDVYAGKSFDDFMTMLDNGEHKDLYTPEMVEQMDALDLAYKNAIAAGLKGEKQKSKIDKLRSRYISDAYASALSASLPTPVETKQAFQDLKLRTRTNKYNPRQIVLAEEIDNDIISKLSPGDYQVILRSHANNPIEFKTMINDIVNPQKTKTIKSTSPEDVDLARAKYYESKGMDVSMVNASMTIKGDPFWLEGYMPPSKAKLRFKDKGALLIENNQSTINGFQNCVVVSGVSDGVDMYDNVLTRNLITYLYQVESITSSFSAGRFTQTLTMIRNVGAEHMVDSLIQDGQYIPELAAEVIAVDNGLLVYENEPPISTTFVAPDKATTSETTLERGVYITKDGYGNIIGTAMREIVIDADAIHTGGPPSVLNSNPHYIGSLADQHGMGVLVTQEMLMNDSEKAIAKRKAAEAKEQELFEDRMKDAMKEYRAWKAVPVKPEITPVGEELVKMADEAAVVTETTEILHEATEVGVTELPSGPGVRQANAGIYLNSLPGLTRACRAEQARGEIPFVTCDAIASTNAKTLAIFETTPGVPPTIAEIEANLNAKIASGKTFSELEIAQFQIAAGGVLTIDGHDSEKQKKRIERIVRKKSLAKTPEIILEEQKNDVSASDVSSLEMGAVVDNLILDETIPLVAIASEPLEVNVVPTPPMTEAEFEAKHAAIVADPNCVGACRSAKIMLLGREWQEEGVKKQYYLDRANEAIINKAKAESESTSWFSNLKDRTLSIIGFGPDTYTTDEHADRIVLSEGINNILDKNVLTADEVVRKEALIRSAVDVLDNEIIENDLIIPEVERDATVGAIITIISNEAALQSLKDSDYATVKAYETGINQIVTTAQTGHRADLTNAANIGMIQGEIALASIKHDALSTKSYYFDPQQELDVIVELEELETDLAIQILAQPDDVITKVATIKSAGADTYVTVATPIEPVDVTKQPVVFKTTGQPMNTYDILLPGTLREKLDAVGGDTSMLSQHAEAQKIYKLIMNTDGVAMKVVTDEAGQKVKIKDWQQVGVITYLDANGDSQSFDPVQKFSLQTGSTINDMYPLVENDYSTIKNGIADLFPNISTTGNVYSKGNIQTRDENGGLVINVNPNKFIVDPTP